jgi:DNA repair protein RadC
MRQDTLPHMPPSTTSYHPPRLKDLPLRERPTSRVNRVGPTAVSLAELLAAVIGGARQIQIAHTLLTQYGSLSGITRASTLELARMDGLGPSKAAALRAALELGRRLVIETPEERPQIRTPADVATLLMGQMCALEQEEFWVVHLDTRNRVLDAGCLYRGTLNQSQVRTAEVFREAVRRNCAAVIVAHSHPSGDSSPSPEDVAVTRDLVAAGKLLGVEVLDHLVIGNQRWVSLRERGLGFDDA